MLLTVLHCRLSLSSSAELLAPTAQACHDGIPTKADTTSQPQCQRLLLAGNMADKVRHPLRFGWVQFDPKYPNTSLLISANALQTKYRIAAHEACHNTAPTAVLQVPDMPVREQRETKIVLGHNTGKKRLWPDHTRARTQTHTHTQTDRQTDRQTDGQTTHTQYIRRSTMTTTIPQR